jgi:hypothetical protein
MRLATAADTPATAQDALRVFYAHTSPRLLTAGALIATAARLLSGAPPTLLDAAVGAGLLAFWPLQEWLIHVFVLHFRPRRVGRHTLDLPDAREHRKHHADPWRVSQVFVPLPSVLFGLIAVPGAALALLPLGAGLTLIATYLVLAVHYEWVHYLCHIRWCPPAAHYRRLVKAHRLHHFKSEKHWLGVSMTAADHLLGTSPDPSAVATSSSTHTVHPPA